MKKVYVAGALAFDRIMNFPGYFKDNILPEKIHNLNVSFNITSLKENYGGTAGNIGFNLGLLGVNATIIASIGKEGKYYLEYLKQKNIDISGVQVIDNEFTACAYIITDKSNNQITGFYMGALKEDTKFNIADNSLVIISPGNIHDMLRYQDQAQTLRIPYIFDPGQTLPFFQPEELKALIQGAHILITNDYEHDLVMKKTGYSHEQLLELVDILIITYGDNGSAIFTKTEKIDIKAVKADRVLDPTGSGDAYRAGLIYGLTNEYDLKTCGQLGSVAAVYAVEEYGTQNHKYTLNEFWQRYNQNFKK